MLSQDAMLLLKEAFKRSLREEIGPINEKSIPELNAWAMALMELATEYREHQFELEELLSKQVDND